MQFSKPYIIYCISSVLLAIYGMYLIWSHPSLAAAFDDVFYLAIEFILTACICIEVVVGLSLCGGQMWTLGSYRIDFIIVVVSLTSMLIDEFGGPILNYHEEDFLRFGGLMFRQGSALFRFFKFGNNIVHMRRQHNVVMECELQLPK